MSSLRLHTRPSFKRSHSDLSRSTTPLSADAEGDDPGSELPEFLRQSQEDIKLKFLNIVEIDRSRIERFTDSVCGGDDGGESSSDDSNSEVATPEKRQQGHRWALELSQDAISRNRYTDIMPWSRNRVRLRVAEGESDYINASPISLARSNGRHVLRYIATQGPKSSNVDHFWQMVWHECGQTAVIVMLTQLAESGREKCFQYYPSEPEPGGGGGGGSRPRTPLSRTPSRASDTSPPTPVSSRAPAPFSPTSANRTLSPNTHGGMLSPVRLVAPSSRLSNHDFSTATQPSLPVVLTSTTGEPLPATVTLIDTQFDEAAHATVRKLSLTCGDEARIVYHLLFSGWPDFAVPTGANRAAMLALIRLSREKNRLLGNAHPSNGDKAAGGSPGDESNGKQHEKDGDDEIAVDGSGGSASNADAKGDSLQKQEQEREQGPRIVHCSAGVGRTGTFIALEHLLAELDSGAWDDWGDEARAAYAAGSHAYRRGAKDPTHDHLGGAWPDPVFDAVSRLREQRASMVQAPPQFAFIYDILAEEWTKRQRQQRLLLLKQQRAGNDAADSSGSAIAGDDGDDSDHRSQLVGPSPKAIRLGQGLKKMLRLGKPRDMHRLPKIITDNMEEADGNVNHSIDGIVVSEGKNSTKVHTGDGKNSVDGTASNASANDPAAANADADANPKSAASEAASMAVAAE